MITLKVNSISSINSAAKQLIKHLNNYNIVAMYGEMGAGKTTLIKAVCNNLDVIDTVTSPTFSLINEYNTEKGQKIYHLDFYRIENIEEIYDFGYEEYFYSNNLCFIEWPEKIKDHLPESTLNVIIKIVSKNKRIVELHVNNNQNTEFYC